MEGRQQEWEVRLGRDDSGSGQRVVGQVVRSDWILGTCEQDEQVDKKSRQPDRLVLGERTFREWGQMR